MVNKLGVDGDCADELKRKLEATAKVMIALGEIKGEPALEVLTGIIVSIITVTANKGREDEIVGAITDALREGVELMKNVKPIGIVVAGVVEKLKRNRAGGNPSLN